MTIMRASRGVQSPQFIALLERSRESIKEGGGFSTEEMKKIFEED
jgi:hypothetical protein